MFTPIYRGDTLFGITFLISLYLVFAPVGAHAQALPLSDGAQVGTYSIEPLYDAGGKPAGDFVVGPGKFELTIKPGQSQTVEMIVSNRTGERRQFNLTTEDAVGSTNEKEAVTLLGNDRGPYSLKDYLSVPHTSFILNHNERARIPVTITLPLDAEPGGLYGSMIAQTVAIEAEPGNTGGTIPQSAIIARVATLFFITIPGDIKAEGALKEFSTLTKAKFYERSPIHFGILFENTGSIHLAPRGELSIHNIFGQEVGTLELEPWFVLPQALRLREVSWEREFLMGRYIATIDLHRGYGDEIDTMSYAFWVLPWQPIVGTFAIIFAIIFAVRAFFRTFEFRRKA